MPLSPTRPATPADAGHEPLLGLPDMRSPRVPVVLMLVSVPLSACTPIELPAGVVDCEGEAVESWRAA
jgi:hypothetical protein